MVRRRHLHPKPVFDSAALREFLEEHKAKPVHAGKIWKYVLNTPGCRLHDIPGLPSGLVGPLSEAFVACSSKVVHSSESQVDHTVKMLIELQDGKVIESVLINHAGETEVDGQSAAKRQRGGDARHALCVSSQVGCRLGCTFCATGKLGLEGNLNPGEIIEQLLHARARGRPVHSVVFMGMGEPLENTDAVLSAIETLVSPHCFSMAARSITVSTVGIVPQMKRLMRLAPSVRLSLSLHAPSQALRETIMPVARAYPLEQVMSVVDEYTSAQGGTGGSLRQRNTMIAYCLISDVNDSDECAEELAALLAGRNVFVNVIPYNPIDDDDRGYGTPTAQRITSFIKVLVSRGICTFERRHHGRDIAAACGQLARDQKRGDLADIEECGCVLGKEQLQHRQVVQPRVPFRTLALVASLGLSVATAWLARSRLRSKRS